MSVRLWFSACLIVLFAAGGALVGGGRLGGGGGTAAPVPVPTPVAPSTPLGSRLESVRLVDFMPAGASWDNLWTNWDPTVIERDFSLLAGIEANTVRVTVEPPTFGFPTPTATMTARLAALVSMARGLGLKVQLTLFDGWEDFSDVSGSRTWMKDLLAPYRSSGEIAFVEAKNEVDPSDTAEVSWLRAIMPALRQDAGSIPITVSTGGAHGVRDLARLKDELQGREPDFWDIHLYNSVGQLLGEMRNAKRIAAPRLLFVGETGMSTYASTYRGQLQLQAEQATSIAVAEADAKSLGLPPAGIWTFSDLLRSGIPVGVPASATELDFGLFSTAGTPKAAAAVLRTIFGGQSSPPLLDGRMVSVWGVPAGWTPLETTTGRLTWSARGGRSGSGVLRISDSQPGVETAWTQPVVSGLLNPGEVISASVWAAGAHLTGSTHLTISWFNSHDHYLTTVNSVPMPNGTHGWTQLTVSATVPGGAAYAKIGLNSTGDTGTVRFTDAAARIA